MGELLAILSMTLFAAANISIGTKHRGKVGRGGAFLSILITLALSFLFWLGLGLTGSFEPLHRTAVAWFALAGVLTALLGRVFLYASIRHLGAVRGAAIKRLNPVFSVILGVSLLGELVSGRMAVGISLIIASFAVLIRQSLRAARDDDRDRTSGGAFDRIVNLGYFHGPISALAYASGYVARKQGLLELPDPAFGTMVGAAAAVICFCLLAPLISSLRSDIRATFTERNPWLWLAGVFTSAGQLTYFAALSYTTVSKIALITSMEVFVTMFLTRVIMRNEVKLPPDVILAACLGAVGTVLVIRY